MRLLVLILTLVLFVLIIAFTIFNLNEKVDVQLFLTDPYTYHDIPLFLIVIFSILFGAFYTGIIALLEGMNLRLNNARLRKTIKKLESELDGLKNVIISQSHPDEDSSVDEETD
jgi:uncharacterized membrane protein YciS (DUF1049 family)